MTIPKLKRIKVSSEQELARWLNKSADDQQEVMIVTVNKTSPTKHLTRDQVGDVVRASGWDAGRRYTLDGNLVGTIIRRV